MLPGGEVGEGVALYYCDGGAVVAVSGYVYAEGCAACLLWVVFGLGEFVPGDELVGEVLGGLAFPDVVVVGGVFGFSYLFAYFVGEDSCSFEYSVGDVFVVGAFCGFWGGVGDVAEGDFVGWGEGVSGVDDDAVGGSDGGEEYVEALFADGLGFFDPANVDVVKAFYCCFGVVVEAFEDELAAVLVRYAVVEYGVSGELVVGDDLFYEGFDAVFDAVLVFSAAEYACFLLGGLEGYGESYCGAFA